MAVGLSSDLLIVGTPSSHALSRQIFVNSETNIEVEVLLDLGQSLMGHKTRIMYIEYKREDVVGPARIGRVTYSKTGKSIYYRGRTFGSLKGHGSKANYFDVETREEYWISGCKKDGSDALYPTTVEIDEDVREQYWVKIRRKPESKGISSFRAVGKYSK